MVLKLRKRGEAPRKKVLIYGMDGSGKSTFAANYCVEHGLNPVCIDVDDTNFTNVDILDLSFKGDVQTYNSIKDIIDEIEKSNYDTIILDGVTSLLEMLTSKARGMAAYSDRAKRWNDILHKLNNSKKHLIFVGQIDMEMMFNEDYQPSKAVIHVNSMVNEKYKTFVDKDGEYKFETLKCRTMDMVEAQVSKPEVVKEEPKKAVANNIDSVSDIAESIIAELPNKSITDAKLEVMELLKASIITREECPEIIKKLEERL